MKKDEQEEKPSAGVWTLEEPKHPKPLEISGLVDPENPEVTVPFIPESKSVTRAVLRSVWGMPLGVESSGGARAILRPIFGMPFCLCGFMAALPFFALAMVKLSLPLLADGWIPARLQGFNSAHTVSHYLPTVGLWDLSTVGAAAKCGLIAVLSFCCCCALPWWQCYARMLLANVPEVPWGSDADGAPSGETERLLPGRK